MSQSVPVIYFLYGDDEFAIAQFVKEMESKLGDSSIAEMNISRFGKQNYNFSELISTSVALPFLTRRRLIILSNPSTYMSTKEFEEGLIPHFEQIPESTAFVLIEIPVDEDREIKKFKERQKKQKIIFKAVDPKSNRFFIQELRLPKGNQMAGWIQDKVRSLGGAFTPQGAAALASLVGNDTRLATQEIEKLLAFVNYQRAVDADDVDMITADYAQADIFALVDAVSVQQPRQEMTLLLKLLDQQEPIMTFVMIQRQFRLLLQAREVIDQGGDAREIMKQLKLHPFVSEKLNNQARRFDLQQLETVYRRLLDLDEGIKTGQIDADLALQTFVAAFTIQ